MTRLGLALIRANMIKAHQYFPEMSRRKRLEWAIAKANLFGQEPKVLISATHPKVPTMFARSYFR